MPTTVPRRLLCPTCADVTQVEACAPGIKPLPQAIAELEAHAIREGLAATGGNKVAAARLLGIARAALYERLLAAGDLPAD